jgi:hypothetical protein
VEKQNTEDGKANATLKMAFKGTVRLCMTCVCCLGFAVYFKSSRHWLDDKATAEGLTMF